MNKKVVIIGGGAAGPKAAAKLRRLDPNCIIDMYTQEDFVSYSACGLPYFVEGLIDDYKKLIVRTPEQFENHGINVHLEMKCIKILPEAREVIIKNLKTGEEFSAYYDILLLATGARPFIPKIENVDLENVFTLRTIHDGIKIRETMKKSKKVTIVGGGYIAIELLEAFIANGLEVTIVEISKHIMSIFDDEISCIIQNFIKEREGDKVNILTDDAVVKFEGENGAVKKVITKNGNVIDTDFVVIAAGVVPNTELVDGLGIRKGFANTIWVNNDLQTSQSGIYAAGDCTEKQHQVTYRPCWLPLGSTANKEGRCAAINISGENCSFEGVLGSAVTRYFGFTMSITGITEKEAKRSGFNVISVLVNKKDKAGYMPDVRNITIKLVVDKNTRSILGAQAIGCGEANQRIVSVSSAISMRTKIEDFLHLDLPYAPPYSPAIDPLLNAAQIIHDKLEKEAKEFN